PHSGAGGRHRVRPVRRGAGRGEPCWPSPPRRAAGGARRADDPGVRGGGPAFARTAGRDVAAIGSPPTLRAQGWPAGTTVAWRYSRAGVSTPMAPPSRGFRSTGATTWGGSALPGSDAAGALGVARHVVLPFDRIRFRRTSVVGRPGDWGPLYDAV